MIKLPLQIYVSLDNEISLHENPLIKQSKYILGIDEDMCEHVGITYTNSLGMSLAKDKIKILMQMVAEKY